MTDELFDVSWDRGKKTKEEAKQLDCFDFFCPECASTELDVFPSGTPWLHENYAEGLPKNLVYGLRANAKPLLEAISISSEVCVVCSECEWTNIFAKSRIRDEQVRRWYDNKYNEGGIYLNIEEDHHEETCDEEKETIVTEETN